jgi:hypothetical protein
MAFDSHFFQPLLVYLVDELMLQSSMLLSPVALRAACAPLAMQSGGTIGAASPSRISWPGTQPCALFNAAADSQ